MMWPLSQDRFQALLDNLPAVFYADSHEPRPATLYLSPNAESVLGAGAEEHLRDPDLWWRSIDPDDIPGLMRAWTDAYTTERPYVTDYRYHRPDGTVVWLQEHAAPVRDADGAITHWQGVLLDVSAERKVLEDLRVSEARYRTLVEQLPVITYAVTDEAEPSVLYVSPTAIDVLGLDPERLAGDLAFPAFVLGEDRDAARRAWEHAFGTGNRFDAEYRVARSDGSIVWMRDTCMRVEPVDGPPFWQGVMLDITLEKEREAALQTSESTFRSLVERLPAVVYLDTNESPSRSVYVSPNADEILGRGAAEHVELGGAWVELIHPEDRPGFEQAWGEAVGSDRTFDHEYRWLVPDGRVIWVHDRSWPITWPDGTRYWQGVLVDITAQRTAEQELLVSQARYRALIENIPAVVYEMDDDDERRTLYVSVRIEELLGYSREEWLDQPDIWTELLHPDDREEELAAHDRQSRTGEPWAREYRLIAVDGREVWIHDQARLVRDAEGRPLAWQGILFDITGQKAAEAQLVAANDELEMRVLERTVAIEEANELMGLEVEERRRAERELRVAEARFRRLVEDMPAAVYTWEPPEHDVPRLYVSPGVERILGYTPQEWTTTPGLWQSRVHPLDRDRVRVASAHSGATGEPFDQEYRYLAKDGRVAWVVDHATLISRSPDGRPALFQGVMVDVTVRKEAERKAEEAEARFRSLIESGPAMAYAYRHDGDPPQLVAEYLSPRLAQLFGLENADALVDAEAWFALVHPDDVAEVRAQAATSEVAGEPWDMRYRILAPRGVVWIHDRGRAVEWGEHGRPVRFIGAIWDVTDEVEERRALEERAALLDDLFSGLPAMVWTEATDLATGRPTFPAIEGDTAIYGYTADELRRGWDHVPRLVHPEDRARVDANNASAQRSPEGLWEDEYRIVRRDGSLGWVHGRARRVTPFGESPAVWHGITIDVTARHAGEHPVADPEIAGTDRV